MELYDNCSDKFKVEIADRLNNLVLVYRDSDEIMSKAAAFCTSENALSNHSSIVMFTDSFLGENNNEERYNFMLGGFIHECGHAYANNIADPVFLPGFDRDDNSTWQTIYKIVSSDEANRQILRDYSLSNKHELFADSTMYYYTDPDRLKMVDINIDGCKTLYDYMDKVLN